MTKGSKTVTLYLLDGELSGRIKCTVGGWLGVAYKSPREAMGQFDGKDLACLQQVGIYFLFGTNDEEEQTVYIGQARARKNGNGLISRIQEPHPSINWTEAIMLTTKDNSFGLDDICYLENYFCNLALDVGKYQVTNGNDPNPGNIPDEKKNDLSEFIEYTEMVMSALGYKVFEHEKPQLVTSVEKSGLLYMRYGKGEAIGMRTNDGFMILKGSSLNPGFTKTCREGVRKMREKYADKINKDGKLTDDILLKSPSTAASFIGGAELNGLKVWKDSEGRTLKEIEE